MVGKKVNGEGCLLYLGLTVFFPNELTEEDHFVFHLKSPQGLLRLGILYFTEKRITILLEKTLLSCDVGNYENVTSCEVLTRCCPWTKSWCNHIYNLILQAKS